MLLVAEVLGVKPHDEAVDAFALIEGAMNAMDIKSMLPSLAHPVEIAEVDKDLNRGDQILVRTAGRKEVFHHGIFIGHLPGVLEEKNLVVDFWGPPKEGKHGARIRLRTLTEFITMPRQRAAQLAVMRWKRDTQDLREFTATLALTLHKDLKDCSVHAGRSRRDAGDADYPGGALATSGEISPVKLELLLGVVLVVLGGVTTHSSRLLAEGQG
eukprot:gene8934-biopygen2842